VSLWLRQGTVSSRAGRASGFQPRQACTTEESAADLTRRARSSRDASLRVDATRPQPRSVAYSAGATSSLEGTVDATAETLTLRNKLVYSSDLVTDKIERAPASAVLRRAITSLTAALYAS
jgi:hypothetical protein